MPISIPPRFCPVTGRLLPPACVPSEPAELALLAQLRANTAEFQRQQDRQWKRAVTATQADNGIFFDPEDK